MITRFRRRRGRGCYQTGLSNINYAARTKTTHIKLVFYFVDARAVLSARLLSKLRLSEAVHCHWSTQQGGPGLNLRGIHGTGENREVAY